MRVQQLNYLLSQYVFDFLHHLDQYTAALISEP